MFCPKCELEIKGDNKKECPICDSPLVESPFDVTPAGGEHTDDDDAKLRELISDIDEKVSRTLDKNDNDLPVTDSAIVDGADEGPSADAFSLSDEDDKMAAFDSDISAELSGLGDELDSIIDGLQRDETASARHDDGQAGHRLSDADAAPAENLEQSDVTAGRSLQEETDELTQKLAEIDTRQQSEVDDVEPPASEASEDLTTRAILDQALEDLESVPGPETKKSRAVPALIAILFICVIAGGVYYYRSDTTVVVNRTDAVPAPAAIQTATSIPVEPAVEAVLAPEADETVDGSESAESPVPDDAGKDQEAPLESPAAAAADVPAVEEPPAQTPEAAPAVAQQEKAPAKPQPGVQKPAAESPIGRYSIHAGSYPQLAVAEKEVERLAKLGFDAFSSKADLGEKGIWYRVKIGNFETRKQAEAVLALLKSKDTVPSRIVRQD